MFNFSGMQCRVCNEKRRVHIQFANFLLPCAPNIKIGRRGHEPAWTMLDNNRNSIPITLPQTFKHTRAQLLGRLPDNWMVNILPSMRMMTNGEWEKERWKAAEWEQTVLKEKWIRSPNVVLINGPIYFFNPTDMAEAIFPWVTGYWGPYNTYWSLNGSSESSKWNICPLNRFVPCVCLNISIFSAIIFWHDMYLRST
jgi:hypothetical protein